MYTDSARIRKTRLFYPAPVSLSRLHQDPRPGSRIALLPAYAIRLRLPGHRISRTGYTCIAFTVLVRCDSDNISE